MDAEKYIWSKSLVKQILKLITGVAKQPDVPNLKTSLFLANTQAVRQIIEEKTFYLHWLFLTLQDWLHSKKDPVLSWEFFIDKLYNVRVHLNLGKEICASWPLVLISIQSDKADLEQFGAFGKKEEASGCASSTTIITNTSPTISASTSPKVVFFGNTLCNNWQSANAYAFRLYWSNKFVFDNKIFSGKADLSILYMMPKPIFVKKVDDDNNDSKFKLVFRIRVVFAKDN